MGEKEYIVLSNSLIKMFLNMFSNSKESTTPASPETD